MKVLSLFDGMSCGQQALHELGIPVSEYYASEIDKYAIQIAKKNFPNTIHLGDVRTVKAQNLPEIDLLLGGSPCQGFSFAGKQLNFDDPRSALFFEFVRVMKETKPKYFLLENVRMKQEYQDVITAHMGVKPIMINSSLLSAQNRVRLYWTNIPNIEQPKEQSVVLQDILEDEFVADREKSYCIDANYYKGANWEQYKNKSRRQLVTKPQQVAEATDINGHDMIKRVYSPLGKSPALTTMQGGHREPKVSITETKNYYQMNREGAYPNQQQDRIRKPNKPSNTLTSASSSIPQVTIGAFRGRYEDDGSTKQKLEIRKDNKTNSITTVQKDNVVVRGLHYRKLTPLECERLQTLPDNYTEGVSNTQRYKMIGNGWTVAVIKHILKNIMGEYNG